MHSVLAILGLCPLGHLGQHLMFMFGNDVTVRGAGAVQLKVLADIGHDEEDPDWARLRTRPGAHFEKMFQAVQGGQVVPSQEVVHSLYRLMDHETTGIPSTHYELQDAEQRRFRAPASKKNRFQKKLVALQKKIE